MDTYQHFFNYGWNLHRNYFSDFEINSIVHSFSYADYDYNKLGFILKKNGNFLRDNNPDLYKKVFTKAKLLSQNIHLSLVEDNIIYKKSGSPITIPFHQDLCYWGTGPLITCFISLSTTNTKNGGFTFFQNNPNNFTFPHILSNHSNQLTTNSVKIPDHLLPTPETFYHFSLNPGDCFFFNQFTPYSFFPNVTDIDSHFYTILFKDQRNDTLRNQAIIPIFKHNSLFILAD